MEETSNVHRALEAISEGKLVEALKIIKQQLQTPDSVASMLTLRCFPRFEKVVDPHSNRYIWRINKSLHVSSDPRPKELLAQAQEIVNRAPVALQRAIVIFDSATGTAKWHGVCMLATLLSQVCHKMDEGYELYLKAADEGHVMMAQVLYLLLC